MLSNPLTNTNTNNMNSEYFGDGEFEFVSEFSRPFFKARTRQSLDANCGTGFEILSLKKIKVLCLLETCLN